MYVACCIFLANNDMYQAMASTNYQPFYSKKASALYWLVKTGVGPSLLATYVCVNLLSKDDTLVHIS